MLKFEEYRQMVNDHLTDYIPELDDKAAVLRESMVYSLSVGGKRLRPVLLLASCDLAGGDPAQALPYAASLEYIHTYSLIHDDLPCMDDDDLRRGKPSNHKVFGEDTALLAGDALQTLAFEILSSEKTAALAGDKACRKAVNTLAKYSGCVGMAGGQMIDLVSENTHAPLEVVEELIGKKTACLLQAACELGCIAANADDDRIKAASEYGRSIGYAFQIQDDILDMTSSNEVLGKPVGSDEENNKSTIVSLLGIEQSRKLVDEYTAKAIAALGRLGGSTKGLSFFALDLAKRVK